jgi:uncharacterized OsmC-like protein
MKFSLSKVAAFLIIGASSLSIYNATDKHIAYLDNLNVTITRNNFTNTYKIKTFENSKEIVYEVDAKEAAKLMALDKQVKQSEIDAQNKRLADAKEEFTEIKILQKLINNGIELTEEEMEDILPAATRRIRELDKQELLKENPPQAPALNKKPAIRI